MNPEGTYQTKQDGDSGNALCRYGKSVAPDNKGK